MAENSATWQMFTSRVIEPDSSDAKELFASLKWRAVTHEFRPPEGEMYATHTAILSVPGMGRFLVHKLNDGTVVMEENVLARFRGTDA